MNDPPARRTAAIPAASRGGERRVRAVIGLARRLADVGLRYRACELQLLAAPVAVALLAAWAPASGAPSPVPLPAWTVSVGLCLLFLGVNAGLSLVLPWADQHLFPLVAMLAALAWALLAAGAPTVEAALGFPGMAAVIALWAALALRMLRLTVAPAARSGRPRRAAPRRSTAWLLHAGTAILGAAVAALSAAAWRALPG